MLPPRPAPRTARPRSASRGARTRSSTSSTAVRRSAPVDPRTCGSNVCLAVAVECSACSFANKKALGEPCTFDDITQCSSGKPDDLPYEACSTWCKSTYADVHCEMCGCKSCGFCKAAFASRVPCQSFAPRDDTPYEKCDSFCSSRYPGVHCSFCRCRGCSWCKSVEMCDPTKRSDCPCEPEKTGDSNVMQCNDWCKSYTHCTKCKYAAPSPCGPSHLRFLTCALRLRQVRGLPVLHGQDAAAHAASAAGTAAAARPRVTTKAQGEGQGQGQGQGAREQGIPRAAGTTVATARRRRALARPGTRRARVRWAGQGG